MAQDFEKELASCKKENDGFRHDLEQARKKALTKSTLLREATRKITELKEKTSFLSDDADHAILPETDAEVMADGPRVIRNFDHNNNVGLQIQMKRPSVESVVDTYRSKVFEKFVLWVISFNVTISLNFS